MTRSPACGILAASILAAIAMGSPAYGGEERAVVGSYRLAKRVMLDGKVIAPPDVIGFMTFTKGHRTVIMKWTVPGAEPASIAEITSYTLVGEKFCEQEEYGVNGNLGAPGVTYDKPATERTCTAAISDASGLAFDVPGEPLRFRVGRDGILATTSRWTDHWEKVK